MRRAVLALLWALVLWNSGAMLAYFGGLPGAVGPLLGILGGAFVFLGPGGRIRSGRTPTAPSHR